MATEEIEIKEITIEKFSNKNLKMMIVGNEKFNHDSVVDKFILDLIINQEFEKGSILSHEKKIDQYYSFCKDITNKIQATSLFKRYSSVLKTRIFTQNTYFIMDNLFVSDNVFKEIHDNLQEKHMLTIFYYPSIVPFLKLDYLVLTESIDDSIMYIAYEIVKCTYDIPYESFTEIIQDFINQEYFVVVKYKNKTLKVIKL